MSSILPLLDLGDLGTTPFAGLTAAQGNDLAEAAAFCFELNGHGQGVQIRVLGIRPATYQTTWRDLPSNVAAARHDHQEATEYGAAGLAILLVRKHLGFKVVMRSQKKTGYDYVMCKEGTPDGTVYAKLEVSGILKGTGRVITSRVNQKIKQVREGKDSEEIGPAYVVVVEFSEPTARVVNA